MRKGPRLPAEAIQPFTIETPPLGAPGLRGADGAADVGAPSLEEKPPALDWQAVFGNDHPVEIEVGSGKGLFLVTAGHSRPERNFLGIEIVRKYQLYTATRLAKRQLTNVRVVCADARLFLRDRVASGSVQTVHVYFPDPWWKTRHHKRRVFTLEFAVQCVRVLRSGGELLVATDVADYATLVRETTAGCPELREIEPPAEHEPAHDMDYLTNFERKFRQEGRAIHRMRFEKVETPPG